MVEQRIADAWRDYDEIPLPGWASHTTTLFDCEPRTLRGEGVAADFACASISFDGTASSRAGAKNGPAAIRRASLAYSSQAQSRGSIELRNMRTGLIHKASGASIIDYGDLHVFQSDPQRQIEATIAESYRVVESNKTAVFLGGEHTLSVATYHGTAEVAALRRQRLAYLQIDHHFDFGDQSVLHGRYYHGSNARRISELSVLPKRAMGFFGVGDLTSNAQFTALRERGYKAVSTLELQDGKVESSLHSLCGYLLESADSLYVSVDIDVCDTSCAPGTGHVTVGGLNSRQFLAIAEVLKHYPVMAIDLVEVSPDLDGSGATASLGARFLFEYMCLGRGESA